MMWTSVMAMMAAGSKRIAPNQQQGWTGRLVVRILPPDAEADYEYIQKPPLRRINASRIGVSSPRLSSRQSRTPLTNVSSLGKGSQLAFESCEDRWTTMDIYLTKPDNEKVEHVHMNRATQELVSAAFQRMELGICKKLERTLTEAEVKQRKRLEKKRMGDVVSPRQPVWITPSGDEWNVEGLSNGDFWSQVATKYSPNQLSVDIAFEDTVVPLSIDSCPPSIVGVRAFHDFEGNLYVGVPLVVDMDLMYCDRAIVDWYVDGELAYSDSRLYTPTHDNIGKDVVVVITPVRPGHDGQEYREAYQFVQRVAERPLNLILPLRQEWTSERKFQESSLRVVTFNILANEKAFMDSRSRHDTLYPYCDEAMLNRNRRMPLILHEILSYHADIICLQEVDESGFKSLFHPTLREMGYQGFYRAKRGTHEGIAMFWSLDVFEEAGEDDMQALLISKLFPKSKEDCLEDWKSMQEVYEFLEQEDDLRNVVTKKLGHAVQIATLSPKSKDGPKKLIVSNTHLFFHSLGHHIRLLQLFAICHRLHKERRGYPLLLCGDFNSTPYSAAVHLLLDRKIPHDHSTAWKHLNSFSWEAEEHEKTAMDLMSTDDAMYYITPPTVQLPDSFPLLKSGYPEFPPFTHYILDFCGTLDYILTSQADDEKEPWGLVATACAPTPSSKSDIDEDEHVAMPNKAWPSDHVSLVCDFRFQQQAIPTEEI